jgi:hypothetical protein
MASKSASRYVKGVTRQSTVCVCGTNNGCSQCEVIMGKRILGLNQRAIWKIAHQHSQLHFSSKVLL